MNAEEVIEILWQIIDDIDSASDMCKGNKECYEATVQKLQAKRWELPIITDGYRLDLSEIRFNG